MYGGCFLSTRPLPPHPQGLSSSLPPRKGIRETLGTRLCPLLVQKELLFFFAKIDISVLLEPNEWVEKLPPVTSGTIVDLKFENLPHKFHPRTFE